MILMSLIYIMNNKTTKDDYDVQKLAYLPNWL